MLHAAHEDQHDDAASDGPGEDSDSSGVETELRMLLADSEAKVQQQAHEVYEMQDLVFLPA